jgi:hypothetical protein
MEALAFLIGVAFGCLCGFLTGLAAFSGPDEPREVSGIVCAEPMRGVLGRVAEMAVDIRQTRAFPQGGVGIDDVVPAPYLSAIAVAARTGVFDGKA